MKGVFVIIFVFVLVSCGPDTSINREYKGPIFTKISSEYSGLNFINHVEETPEINVITYDYFYNGGGVAIGDINNDGLSDIYLTGNKIKNALYLNKGNLQFEDITSSAGVDGGVGWSTGVTMADVNGDGFLDIYVCRSGKYEPRYRTNRLYINNGDLTFSEKSFDYGIDDAGYSTQASFFDYDNDGDLDMYLLNHNVTRQQDILLARQVVDFFVSDKLYEFDGGVFKDVTRQSGIKTNSIGYGLGIATGDLNNDGFTDIYITNDYLEQDYMYYNNGDKTFSEVVKEKTNHTSLFSMGCDIGDINNDGWLDILAADMVAEDNYRQKTNMAAMNPEQFYMAVKNGFHHQYMINTLQLNNGNSFSEIAQLAGISKTDWSWATLFVDLDNNGYKDILITNGYRKETANKDFVKYQEKKFAKTDLTDTEEKAKVIMELLNQMPSQKVSNYVFKNEGNLKFSKASKEWGIADPSFSNGAAYADLDNDGDLELVINNIDDEVFLYKNLSSENRLGNYLSVQLEGPSLNKNGIGTKLELTNGKKTIFYEHYNTHGYQSAIDDQIVIGLGEWSTIESIRIIWPGNYIQDLTNIAVNTDLEINFSDAVKQEPNFSYPSRLFKEITATTGVNHEHKENVYDDFEKEILLPHRMSTLGPFLTVGDINNDGIEDFFVGGCAGQPGTFFIQGSDGKFSELIPEVFLEDAGHEDMGALLFDYDNDNDLDLYVVSGGNEKSDVAYYQDRLYVNEGGVFNRAELPEITGSGAKVVPSDMDDDGFLDLFVCGRQSPGRYPYAGKSYLLRNNNGKEFVEVTDTNSMGLSEIGMVTDAVFFDFDGDEDEDLMVVGEWMNPSLFINEEGNFTKKEVFDQDQTGWWFSVAAADINKDLKIDIIGGNLGLNYKYKASHDEPFQIYANDFDENGTLDIVLSYYNEGDLFPLRGRQCSSQQMPFISEKFENYDAFGKATLNEVYGEALENAVNYKARNFASSVLTNKGDSFELDQLPIQAQFSSINSIIPFDFNKDSNLDLLVAGNLFASEIETTRNDASRGLVLFGKGDGTFEPIDPVESGVDLMGDVKDLKLINLATGELALIVANNQAKLQILQLNTNSKFATGIQ